VMRSCRHVRLRRQDRIEYTGDRLLLVDAPRPWALGRLRQPHHALLCRRLRTSAPPLPDSCQRASHDITCPRRGFLLAARAPCRRRQEEGSSAARKSRGPRPESGRQEPRKLGNAMTWRCCGRQEARPAKLDVEISESAER
jgi:hypothetical protein